jgi:hypothetical protein
MSLECNIDAKGRAVRLALGIALTAFGCLLLLAGALTTGSVPLLGISVLAIAAGAFAIFESRAGWCALRALGFKTRI